MYCSTQLKFKKKIKIQFVIKIMYSFMYKKNNCTQ